ncbi:DUF4381 domain-containing protein [Alishewanella sp. 16-MA]|uniref:DUF4381 domain-containing protein n=1 Tax=Alishewanella maricola TaxID=2795740 RepID=A0ABS8C362_9ALTE|nr:DUF4381 domain-containing protein [Alishewanella maricola]MCB5226751.1 DUF4381 domain-containing protein [Alishewanella maricola]MDP5036090.1 DUF4381 domain-containing protein [Alishewanella sp.]
MADKHDLLPQLADIYEPELASSMLPPLGYWLLALLALTLLTALLFWRYRAKQQSRVKRAAMAELAQIDWQSPQAATALNVLLKRLLKHYQPSHPLLSASTEQWQAFLQQQLPAQLPLPPLATLLYQAPGPDKTAQQQQFWLATQHIIKQLDPVQGFTSFKQGGTHA